MADNFIFIDRNTSFSGTIIAEEVIIEGVVKGDITASEKVLVKNGAVINGDILTDQLLFEEGGKHNGMIRLGQPEADDTTLKEEPDVSLPPENSKDRSKKSPEKRSKEGENSQRLW